MRRETLGLALALAMAVGVMAPSGAWAGELAKARGLMESGQYQDAIPVLEKFTKTFPNEPRGWALLADCYQNVDPPRVNEVGQALSRRDTAQNKRTAILTSFAAIEPTGVYERLVSDEPQDIQDNLLLGIAYTLNDHDAAKAKAQLDRTAKLVVGSDLKDAFYNAWGLYYIEVKDWENARKMFHIAKRTSTFALGKLQEVDKLESAQRREQEAAENDPARIAEKRFNELMTEARTMTREGRHEAAVDLLEDALHLKAGDNEAQTMLGENKLAASIDLYWEGKKMVDGARHAEAYDKFDRALQMDPTNASASLGLEYVKKKLAELDQPKIIRRFIPASGSAVPAPTPAPAPKK